MVIWAILFLGSLFGIALLFGVKYGEVRRGLVLAPEARTKADARALELKAFLVRVRMKAERVPPITVLFIRYLVHESALLFARTARAMERGAHRVAEIVSHSRGADRRTRREDDSPLG